MRLLLVHSITISLGCFFVSFVISVKTVLCGSNGVGFMGMEICCRCMDHHDAGGAASPSSPLAPSVSGSSSQDSVAEHVSKMTLDGKLPHYSSGSSVIVEISNINKVKESYTEDLFQVISQHKSADSFIFYFLIVLIGISFSICTLKYLIACFFLLFCDSM